jgi:hypothetical protein
MIRRNRHIPRVCNVCGAPLGGNEDACAACNTLWREPVPPAAVSPG